MLQNWQILLFKSAQKLTFNIYGLQNKIKIGVTIGGAICIRVSHISAEI